MVGELRVMGSRRVSGTDSLQISHDLIEWRGRLDGLDGLLLLLFLMFLLENIYIFNPSISFAIFYLIQNHILKYPD